MNFPLSLRPKYVTILLKLFFEITIGPKKHEFPTFTRTKRTYLQVTCENCTQIYYIRGVD
jgi:hypothetical protein